MGERSYDENYLRYAMMNLGVMLDSGVRKCSIPMNRLYEMFLESDISVQFGQGNPKYIVGTSGSELLDLLMGEYGMEMSEDNDGTYRPGPEFWTGQALAFYQWTSGRSFQILNKHGINAEYVVWMYYPLHEASFEKFTDVADEITGFAANPI